jgi:hypothetical protein
MSATSSGWHQEMYLTVDQGMFVMPLTESNAIEQMILDDAAKLRGKPAPVRHWNTRLSELTL